MNIVIGECCTVPLNGIWETGFLLEKMYLKSFCWIAKKSRVTLNLAITRNSVPEIFYPVACGFLYSSQN